MFKSNPLPTLKKNGSVVVETIKGKKYKRPLSKKSKKQILLNVIKDLIWKSILKMMIDANEILNESPLEILPKKKGTTYGLQKF